MPTFYKCRACGKQHLLRAEFGSRESFDTAVVSGCRIQCPETGQMALLDKEDLLYMERVHFLIVPDDGGYSALCYEFNVAACGDTPEETQRNLAGVVNDYLRYLADEARLEEAVRPASNELLLEFLGLDPEELTPEAVAGVLRKATLEAAEVRADAALDSTLGKAYEFKPPDFAVTGPVMSYPVQISLHGG
jgi:hypothetical protein